MSEAYIYALVDPETRVARYIGKTQNPARRMGSHRQGGGRRKLRWFDYLKTRNLSPDMEILETASDGQKAQVCELAWIRHAIERGNRLVNGYRDIDKATGTHRRPEFVWEHPAHSDQGPESFTIPKSNRALPSMRHVGTALTPELHLAFKIACIDLGTTMDRWLEDAAREAIVRASLMKEATNGTD